MDTCSVRNPALWYNPAMNTLKDVMEHAATWPREDQEKLAEYAREIEARRTGIYTMSDGERSAVARGLAEADRGEFVSDELMAEADKRDQREGSLHP
jgi:predicted transcriptional regulator